MSTDEVTVVFDDGPLEGQQVTLVGRIAPMMLWVELVAGRAGQTRPGNEPPEDPAGWAMYRTRLPVAARRRDLYRGTLVGQA